MSARQFTDGALNGTALVHALFERFSFLIAPAFLQKLVMLTNDDRAMRLAGGHAVRAQGTAAAMVAPFKAKSYFLPIGLG